MVKLATRLNARIVSAIEPERIGISRTGDHRLRIASEGTAAFSPGAEVGVLDLRSCDWTRLPLRLVEQDTANQFQRGSPIVSQAQLNWETAQGSRGGLHSPKFESEVFVPYVIRATNRYVATVVYRTSKFVTRFGDGIAKIDTRDDHYSDGELLQEVGPTSSILAVAMSRTSERLAYLIGKRNPSDKGSPLRLCWQGYSSTPLVPKPKMWPHILYDSDRGIVLIGNMDPTLQIYSRTKRTAQVVRIPNSSSSEMSIGALSWETKGTALVEIRKVEKWNSGRNRYVIPKLYRFNIATQEFTYLGCYYLLGSSLRGEWLLVGDGPRLARVFLLKVE
jgi:hypothetical protein